jgi:hypothetical protein
MSEVNALRRLAVISVLLAVVIAVPSSIAFVAAFGSDIEAAIFGDPAAILDGGPEAAALLRWGAFGDMLFSYLLLVPPALFLHRRLRSRLPWLADLGMLGALAYALVGGAAAAILATVGPSLIDAYATAAPGDRPAIATSFHVLRDVVFFALWQTLDPITFGTWVLSVGWLVRPERRALGAFLLAVSVGVFAAGVQTMLGLHSVLFLSVGLAIPLLVWVAWLAVDRTQRSGAEP